MSRPPITARAASTMVIVIRFSQRCEGWHGRSGSERRGSGLPAQPGPITPTLRRDVPSFNVQMEGLGRRRLATSGHSKSDRTRQHSRSYSGPVIKRCTLSEVSMYWDSSGVLYQASSRLTSSSAVLMRPAGRHLGPALARHQGPLTPLAVEGDVPLHQDLERPVASATARTERPSTSTASTQYLVRSTGRLRTGVPELLTHRVGKDGHEFKRVVPRWNRRP